MRIIQFLNIHNRGLTSSSGCHQIEILLDLSDPTKIMNRLLQLQTQLISLSQDTFQSYRKRSSIDKDQFNRTVYGPNYMQRMRFFDILERNPELFRHYHIDQTDRSSQRQQSTQQIFVIKKHIDLSDPYIQKINPNSFTLFGNGCTFYDLGLTTKIGVHYSLYLKTIQRLGTTKHQVFYQKACKFIDIGCFGLTQLMHGSNVKGILTQAHYDHRTREIVIHSPSRDAMKFWIGGSAKTANISLIWAQLYIQNICYGVHAFIVPLRDNQTHKVLPGITIGDCGPKFGLNGVDNGFIMFHKFRIPVDNLLDKVSGINEKGEFFSTVQGENKRFGMTLAALSEGRLYMCCHSTSLAIAALTIALRYTFVRRQFTKKSTPKQTLLIDYPLTKRRMIPLLAQQIIYMTVTMKTFFEAENNQQKSILTPANPLLQQIHAISSVLKSKTAWFATETIRQCRQMMGGHGYSAYSKMGVLYSDNDVNNTWEGQNHVLIQQTTKYVLQNFQKNIKGKPIESPTLKFLADPPTQATIQISRQSLLDFKKIQTFLQGKIWMKTQEMGAKMMELKQKGIPSTDVWNSTQVYLGQTIAINTGDLYILNACIQRLGQIKDPNTRKVFQNILHLWTLMVIRNDDSIGEDQHGFIQKIIMEYCELLAPQVLGLLEAVAPGQKVLGSPFADEKGQGFTKYVNLILSKERKERASYWKVLATD